MTLSSFSVRTILLTLFAICAGLLGFALYLQHSATLAEPCPLCILQRYVFLLIGLIALVGGLHNPGRTGTRVYAGLILLAALTGAGLAGNQTYLQLQPPNLASCGPGLEYLVENHGLAKALPMIFSGSGDCASVVWTFLGLSIANWSLLWFCATAVLAVLLMLRKTQNT